jgi:hypothetical protein
MDNQNDTAPQAPTELQVLKQRADLLNITYSNNIGVDALRKKIEAKMEGEPEVDENDDEPEIVETPAALEVQPEPLPVMPEPVAAPVAQVVETPVAAAPVAPAPVAPAPAPEPVAAPAAPAPKLTAIQQKALVRQQMIKDATRLVRIRITCMNPEKADLHGELITVANKFIGTVRRFVPFGEATEDGWHVEHVLYEQLRDRRFLNKRTVKDKRTGVNTPKTSWAKEFAIEILDPLTPVELERLRLAQAAAGSIDNDGSLD